MTTQIQPLLTIADLDCTPDDGNKYELISTVLPGFRAKLASLFAT